MKTYNFELTDDDSHNFLHLCESAITQYHVKIMKVMAQKDVPEAEKKSLIDFYEKDQENMKKILATIVAGITTLEES
jgi:hypothetical protein